MFFGFAAAVEATAIIYYPLSHSFVSIARDTIRENDKIPSERRRLTTDYLHHRSINNGEEIFADKLIEKSTIIKRRKNSFESQQLLYANSAC